MPSKIQCSVLRIVANYADSTDFQGLIKHKEAQYRSGQAPVYPTDRSSIPGCGLRKFHPTFHLFVVDKMTTTFASRTKH